MKKPKCAKCNHVMHTGRCPKYYSAGPSGTFRCPCEEGVSKEPPVPKEKSS